MTAPTGYADDPAAWFAEVCTVLGSEREVAGTLRRVCEQALVVVPEATFCGITVRRRRGRLETLAQTDELARTCDELQYALGEGPCISSVLEERAFLVHETATDPRWPHWGPEVAALGVHSLLSVDLDSDTIDDDRDPLGAVNLYAQQPGAFDQADADRLRTFGVHAGAALATANAIAQLSEAVESRHQVGLAQGVLMNRYGLDPEQAFESLRRFSNDANVKLRDVAAQVIAQGELPGTYEGVDPVR